MTPLYTCLTAAPKPPGFAAKSHFRLILTLILIVLCSTTFARHYYSKVTGNWGTTGTWTTAGCGGIPNLGSSPVAGDTVTICGGHTVTLTAAAFCAVLDVSGTLALANKNITVTGATTVSGTITNTAAAGNNIFADLTLNSTGSLTNTGNDNFTINGNFQNDGTFSPGTGTFNFAGAGKTFSGSSGISAANIDISITGSYTNNTTLTVTTALTGAGSLTQGSNASLYIGGTFTVTTFDATANPNSVYYNSTSANQTVKGTTYHDLIINNSPRTATLGAATIVNGDLTITSGTLALSTLSLTVSGNTSVSGTLSDNNATGTNTLKNIVINSGGIWNITAAAPFTINGDFQNDGTLTAGTGVYTFTGASNTIGGNSAISIPSTTIDGTYTNNGTLSVGTALAGAGTLTQGTNSTLNVGGTFTTANFTATADTNTVNYNSTTAGQTVKGITYHDLIINKSGQTATLGGATTINGNLTLTAGALDDAGYQITGNATGIMSMASGTTLKLGTVATATSFPTSFTNANITLNAASTVNYNSNASQPISSDPAYGNLTLTATGAVTKTAGAATAVNGALTIGTNNTLADGGYTIAVKGNVTNNGTHSGAGKIYLNGGSALHTVSGGTSAFGNIELDDANGASWTGTGTTTVNGNLTITAGTMATGAFTTGFSITGRTDISGTLTTTSTTGTKTYSDIIVNSGGTWNSTVAEDFTTNGNITNNGTFTANTGIYSFTGASNTIGGANALIIANATISGTYTNNGTLSVSTALAGAGTLTQGTNSTLNVGGTFTTANFTANADPNTVNYNSTTSGQTVKGVTYHDLTINKSGQTATLGGATTINGNLTLTAGTLDDAGYQITGNATGIMSMASGTTLKLGTVATATSFPTSFTNANITLNAASTVNYNSNASQPISGVPAYGNLTLTATGAVTKTAGAAATVNGALTIGTNNTLADGGYTITVKGNVTNNGTHSGAGKIYMNGGSALHTISGGTSAFGNIELDDANGASWTGTGTTTVNGNLTVTAGTLSMGAFSTALSVSGSTGISGTLSTTSTTGTKTYTNITVNSGGTWNSTVAEAFTINGNIANNGTFTGNTGVYTCTGAAKTISGTASTDIPNATFTGTYTNNGILNVSTALSGAGSLLQGAGSTLYLGGTNTVTTFSANANPNTVYYNSTGSNQTVLGITYHHLSFANTGRTATLGGNTTVNGDLTITSGTLQLSTLNCSVAGSTSISGTLIDNNVGGTNTFNNITINSGGILTNSGNSAFAISGNLQDDGTLTAGTGVYTFSGASKTISGTNNVIIANATISGTYTNNGTLTVNTALAGAGTLTQGTNSTLNIGGTFTVTNFSAAASPNTVAYISTTAGQTVRNTPYNNLTINKLGQTATLAAATTVNGNLAITAGTLADAGFQITGNATGTMSMDANTTLILGSAASATAFPTLYTAVNISLAATSNVIYISNVPYTLSGLVPYNNLTLSATGPVTITAGGNLTVNGNLTIGLNVTLADAGFTITVKGNVTNNGTHSGAGKIYLNGGSASHTISGGTAAFGNLELNDANGATWTGTATTTVNGTLTVTAGTLAAGAFTTGLSVAGTTGISGTLNITSTTGTKTFGNITVNSGGTWNSTVAEAFTVSGNIANSGTFTGNTGIYTCTGAAKTISGTASTDIPNATFSGTYTNNGILTVSTALSGAGSLLQGAGSTLNLGGTNTVTTFSANANPNTVNYNSTGSNQTVLGITYHHLSFANTGRTATLGGNTTVNGDLTITSGTLQLSTLNCSVAGSTSITGTLIDNNAAGANTFNDLTINSGGTLNNSGNSAFAIGGNLQDDGSLTAGSGVYTFSGAAKTISGTAPVIIPSATINGTYTNNGTLTVNTALAGGGTLTQGINGFLNIGGTFTTTNFTASANPNTVAYTSTTAAQTTRGSLYHHLTINKSGQIATLAMGTTLNGDLTITSGTLELSSFNFTVSGNTSVTGTMSDGNVMGTNSLNNVTINSGGIFTTTGNAAFTINGNLQNDGTLTSGTGVYTFAGASKTISGTNTVTIPSATFSGSYTNNGTLTVNTALAGAGSLTQGAGSALNLGGSCALSTLTSNANPNTVTYTSTTAGQTVLASTYHHLTINKSGQTGTCGGAVTVNGNLTVSAGTLNDGGFQITGNATGTLSVASGATLTLGSAATATSFPTTFSSGNISLNAASTVNYNSNAAQSVSGTPAYGNLTLTATGAVTKTVTSALTVNGTLTIGTNNTFADGGFTITAKSDVTNNGTHSGAGKIYLVSGPGAHAISGGTSAFGNVELNDNGGATWTGTGTTTVNGNLTVTAGTMSADAFTTGLTVNGNTSITGTLRITSVTGTKTFNNITVNGGTWNSTVVEDFTINGNIQNDGTFTSNTGIYTCAGAGKTLSGSNALAIPNVSVSGTYTNNGTLTISTSLAGAGTLSQGTGSTLNIGGTSTITTLTATANPNTVNYNRTTGAQTVKAATYHHLTFNNTGQTATLGGNIAVNGNLTITTGTLALSVLNITVSGTTSITGTLSDANAAGTNILNDLTINGAGTFDNTGNSPFTINGSLLNNGTLTAGTGVYTFAGASKTISGSNTVTIPNASISGTYTNNGTFTVNTSLAGAGTLTQGTNASLNIGGTFTTTNFTATANPNTVTYTSTSAGQTVKGTTYHHLTINKLGQTATMGAALTVNGNLTLTNGTLDDGGYQITGNATGNLSAAANTMLTLGSAATATSFPTVFTNGNISLNNSSTVNYNSNAAQSISGTPAYGNLTLTATGAVTKTALAAVRIDKDLTIGTNNNFADGGFTITAKNDIVNNGTHSGTGKIYLNAGAGAHAISGGTSAFGNVELNDNGGATWTGTGTTTINGNLTITNGQLTTNAFTTGLTVNGNTSISGTLRINNVTGTKTFNNITVNSGGTWNANVAEDVTINGNLQNDATFTANTGIYTFAGAGKTLSGTSGLSIPNTAVTGTYTNNVTLTVSTALTGAGTLTQAAGATLNIGGTSTLTTLTASANPNTVNYYSTTAPQTVIATTYHHLTFNNTGQTATLSGNAAANGNLTITTGTLELSTFNFTVSGNASVTGTLSDNSATGSNSLLNLTINSGGTHTSAGNAAFTINGNLVNNGTLTAGNGVYTFAGASKTISGTSTVTIPSATFSGSYTNNGTLTVNTALAGAGSLTQGTNSSLNVGGTFTTTNFTATANPNTVTYTSTTAGQTVRAATYHHLTINKSGQIGTCGGAVTVNGNLTVSAGTLADGGFQIIGNASGSTSIAAGATLSIGSAGTATTMPTNYSAANIALNATSTVIYNSNLAQTIIGALTYGNLTCSATAPVTKTPDGNVTVTGMLNVGSFNTFLNPFIVTAPTTTINGAFTNNGTLTVSTVLAGPGSLTQGTNSTLNIGGIATLTTLTATANGNTVVYNSTTAPQTTIATTYYNLTIAKNGQIATLGGNTTVNNNLNVTGGTLQFGTAASNTLTVSGNLSLDPGITLRSHQLSSARQHTLIIGGTFTNYGTVNLRFDGDDYVKIVMQGSGTSSIAGTGTWSSLAFMEMNKSNKTDTLHVSSTGFGQKLTTGADLCTTPYVLHLNPPVILTKGVFRYNIPDTLSNLIDPGATGSPSFTINPNVTFRMDQGVVDMAYYVGVWKEADLILQGALIINGGVVSVSKASNDNQTNGLWYSGTSPTPTFTMTGGTLNVFGAFTSKNAGTDDLAFTMSAGNIYSDKMTVNHMTGAEPFWITDHLGSSVNWTGGTLYIQERSKYVDCVAGHECDFDIGGAVMTNWTVTRDVTVVFGTPNTVRTGQTKFMAYPNVVYPNFIVANPGGGLATTLVPFNNSDWKLYSLKVETNQNFDMRDYLTATDNHTMTITDNTGAYSFYNDGTFTARSSTVKFAGTAEQYIAGSTATAFYNLDFQNDCKLFVNASSTATLTLNDVVDLNAKTLTMGSSVTTTGTLAYTSGRMHSGTLKRWFGTAAVANGDNAKGLYPMGTPSGDYRPFSLSYPAGISAGGSLSLTHTGINNVTPVSFADGAVMVIIRHDSYWTSSTTGFPAAGTPFNLRAGGTGYQVGDINDLRLTRISDVVGTAGTNLGTTTNPVVVRTALSRTNLTNNFYIGSSNSSSSPLPIVLVTFTATTDNKTVTLNWQTASEINNDHFDIERSADGLHFEKILTVAGAGNSNQLLKYSAVDYAPLLGVSYYRLKQVDYDGRFVYSQIVDVTVERSIDFMVFPNPSDGSILCVRFSDRLENEIINLAIYDTRGNKVFNISESGNTVSEDNIMQIDLMKKLSKGMYVVKVVAGTMRNQQKLIIR